MNSLIISNIIRFIFLILLQVLVLNKVLLFGYINPLFYIYFIFLFPLNKDKTLFLILSFLLGLSIDFFTNSGGVNASATLFIAFIRLRTLHIIQNKTEFDYMLFNVKKLNFLQAIIYIFTLTFLHHTIVYFFEFYKSLNIISLFGKIIATTLLTGLLISFSIQLFVKSPKS